MFVDPRGQLGHEARSRAHRRGAGQDLPPVRQGADGLTDERAGRGVATDRLFACYLAVAASALLFPHRPPSWPLLLAVHAGAVALLWPLVALPRISHDGLRRRARSLLDWFPLLIVPGLYTELAVLNRAVHDGRYFDDIILGWEQALFRGQPSQEWAAAAPLPWLSELLHFAYLSYYFIIFVPPFILFMRRRTGDFRAMVFTLMLSFFAHYVFFIFLPVQGPRYLFPAPGADVLAGGFFRDFTHRVLEAGSSQGAAFPSSHVGVSVTQTLLAVRYLPGLAPLIAALTIGLALGAIYGGFHYATDAVAGAVLGVIVFIVAPRAAALLRGDRSREWPSDGG